LKAKKVNEAKAVSESGEIVKFDEAGMPQLDVWLEDETIWLTQKQMGFLFGCAPQNITYHLREIYKIGELEADSTCKDFLQVQIEGGRRISRMQKFYNLDAVVLAGDIAPLKGRGPWHINDQSLLCGHIHTGRNRRASGAATHRDAAKPSEASAEHGGVDFESTSIYNVSRLDERYEIAYEPTWVEI
jgi:hypothetical protein